MRAQATRRACFPGWWLALLLTISVTAQATDWVTERRKPQFETETGYAVFPFPYSLPGIGSGLTAVGGVSNAFNSYTDIYAVLLGGDIQGAALGVSEIHAVPQHLFFDVGYSDISKGVFRSYNERGMDSDPKHFTDIEVSSVRAYGGRMTGSFLQRRLELYAARYLFGVTVESIRDKDGNIILKAEDGFKLRGGQNIFGGRVDLTDDFSDPRRGLRVDTSGWHAPKRGNGPEYTLVDINTTAYLPMGKRSTLALNYLKSDAYVQREGLTDRAAVAGELGFDCAAIADAGDRQNCEEYIDNVVAANRHGSASNLGGANRLRAFAEGRFHGAHTRFIGGEFRWNLTDEFTPFDIVIVKDVRTTVQLAFFLEAGTTADRNDQLWDDMRLSGGVGARVITASGVVFRGDVAGGREGVATSVWFDYPWEF